MTTATVDDIISYARRHLRDTGKLFQCETNGNGVSSIFDLPVVCVSPTNLSVTLQPLNGNPQALVLGSDYVLNEQQGQIQLVSSALQTTDTLYIEGTNYTWFVDSTISPLALDVIGRLNEDPVYDFYDYGVNTPQFEVAASGTVTEMLFALYTEASFDVDLRNPEGVDLPVSERVGQLERLLEQWTARFMHFVQFLNIGMDRIEMFTLRRVSRMTGRYVPLYTAQEIDDTDTPTRLHPPIDGGTTTVLYEPIDGGTP